MPKKLLRLAAVASVVAAALISAPHQAEATFSFTRCLNHQLQLCVDTCIINRGCSTTCRTIGTC